MAAQPTTSTPDLHVPEHPVRIVTASALFDGHDASINIMRRIMQAQGAEVMHLGHNRSVTRGRRRRHRGGRAGRRRQLLPGRARRVLRVPRAAAARVGRRPRQGRRGWRRGHRARPRSSGCARPASPSSAPRTASGSGCPGMVNQVVQACDTDLWAAAPHHGGGGALRRALGRGPGDHRGRDRAPRRRPARRAGAGGSRPPHPGARHHRHRRLGQVEPHRRAGAPAAGRPAGQAAGRLRRDRPDPPPRRGSPARRPDPDERARRRPGLLPLARHPRRPRGARGARRRAHHPQGRRLRPRRRRDPRHRPGRRRDHHLRRRQPLRHDAGVRCRQPAREDRHARLRRRRRDQQVRAPRRPGRPARRRPPDGAQPRRLRQEARGHAGVRHLGRHLQRRRRHRALPGAARPARRGRARGGRGRARPGHRAALVGAAPGRAAAAGALPRRDRRDGARLPRRHPPVSPRPRAACSGSPRSVPSSSGPGPTAPGSTRCSTRAQDDLPLSVARQLAGWSSVVEAYSGDEQVVTVRDKEIHTSLVRESLSGNRIRRVSLPRYSDDGDLVSFLRRENLPGHFPFTAGVFLVQARQRGPRADVRRRGRPVPHQPPVQDALAGPARHPAVDRVRLGDPLRPRPRQAARHLRQGRHLRRLGRHPRRHARAVRRVRPHLAHDQRLDDDQRPGADHPRLLPQHRHGPRRRGVGGRAGTRAERAGGATASGRRPCRSCAARCRPTSSRRTRARTPACSPPSSRCG